MTKFPEYFGGHGENKGVKKMVKLIFDCVCGSCDGGTPAGRDEKGNIRYGGSHCICSCHVPDRIPKKTKDFMLRAFEEDNIVEKTE